MGGINTTHVCIGDGAPNIELEGGIQRKIEAYVVFEERVKEDDMAQSKIDGGRLSDESGDELIDETVGPDRADSLSDSTRKLNDGIRFNV